MQMKTALPGFLGALLVGGACEAQAITEPAATTIATTTATSSEYKGVRQTSDAANPAERVPPGMEFVPGSSLETGLDEDDIQALELENPAEQKLFAASVPRHTVEVEPLYLGRFEVTNAQWKTYLDATGKEPSKDLTENVWTGEDGAIPSGHENRPVNYVSYPEVLDFCRWAMVRLPTEHEWERAARGDDGRLYPWGNEFNAPVPKELQVRPRDAEEAKRLDEERAKLPRGGNRAWCEDSKIVGKRGPQAVGTMPDGASPFGIHDMMGNVWEWTASPYSPYPDYEDIKIKSKATRGKAEKVSAAEFFNSSRRVIKGGAFDSPGLALRADVRQFAEQGSWFQTIGFRIAKSVQPGAEAIRYALSDVGSYQFHESNSPLAMDSIQAVELTHFDGDDHITGHQGIVFAPTSDWFKYGKMKDADRESLKGPLSIGLFITSEPSVYPPLAPGTYIVAYQGLEKKWKEPPEFVDTPSRDWTFHGWEEFDSTFKAKASSKPEPTKKSRKSKKDEPAEGEEAAPEEPPEPTEEELDLEKYRYVANEGAIPYDGRRNNILILDQSGTVVAALPVSDLKEMSKPIDVALERDAIGEDKRKKLPKTERFSYTWSIALKGARRHVKFELPIRFAPDAIGAASRDAKVDAEAAPGDR